MVAIMLQKSSQIGTKQCQLLQNLKVEAEMGAWMLEAGTWKVKSWPGNGILEPGSWK